ncbi:MAG: RNA-directed DNA polymerase, partial [Planctomycetota bacterium]|nr:RNA-directed DNA polymerase [Planctomycetota bacterium]
RSLNRAQEYLKRYRYFLKTDIVKFFPNVDHEVLMSTLTRTIRDRDLMKLIAVIVTSGDGVLRDERGPVWFPGDDLFSPLRPCGLPIGNLTSQFFANVLLDGVDHFLKEDVETPGYVRYADDLLLFDNCKTRLWDVRDALVAKLANLRLRLHPHKTQVAPSRRGVGFLGFHITARARWLKQSALRRLNRRLRQLRWQFSNDLLDCPDIRVSVQAWLAHASGVKSLETVGRILRRSKFCRS